MKLIKVNKWLHSERVWIIGCAILLFLLSYAPIIQSFQRTPNGLWYWGAEEYPIDLTENLSTVRQGYNGHWLSTGNISTMIPDAPSILKIEYLLIGHAARLCHIDPTFMFFLARFLLSICYLTVVYLILRAVFESKRDRVIAWLLVLFAGSIMRPEDYNGFYYKATVDVLITYRLLLAMPHYLIGNIAALVSLFFLAKAIDKPFKNKSFVISVIFGLISSLEYAPTMVLILGSLLLYILFQLITRKKIKSFGVMFAYGIITMVPIWYVRWVTISEWDVYRAISHMEKLNPFTVSFGEYLMDLGPVYFLALIGLPRIFAERKTLPTLLGAWILMHPVGVFILSPILQLNPIRFLLTPYFIVFGILAVYGIQQIVLWIPSRWKSFVACFVVFIVFATCAISYQANYNRTHLCFCMQPNFTFAYPTNAEMGGIWWLRDNSKENEVVLSLYYAGNLIPAFAGNRVYTSWWFWLSNDQNIWQTMAPTMAFYKGDLSTFEAQQFIRQAHISYIFWGEEERALAPQLSNLPYNFLHKVSDQNNVVVYKVIY